MMMKIAATTMKVGIRFPFSEARVCPLRTSSGYKIRNPSAESLRMTTSWLTMEGNIKVMAWGNRTSRSVAKGVSPMARPASR
jgi:hypothetical protein